MVSPKDHIKHAEAIVSTLYPSLKEPKLLISCLDHLYLAAKELEKEELEEKELETISKIKLIVQKHKDANVEFGRKGDFFIYDGEYEGERLSSTKIQGFIKDLSYILLRIEGLLINER
jgi:hypothetical protein